MKMIYIMWMISDDGARANNGGVGRVGFDSDVPFEEWAKAVYKERERECQLPGRVEWPPDGSNILAPAAGQPALMFRTLICGLGGVRDDDTYHLILKLDGALWASMDFVHPVDGFPVRLPLPTLQEGFHAVEFEVWAGPGGVGKVRVKGARSAFSVHTTFRGPETARRDSEGLPEQQFSEMRCTGGIFPPPSCQTAGTACRTHPHFRACIAAFIANLVRTNGPTQGIQHFNFPLQRADQFWGTLSDEPPHATTPPDLARQRVCEFRSVCWASGSLVFFRDRSFLTSSDIHLHGSSKMGLESNATTGGGGFLALSYMHDGVSINERELSLPAPLWSPAVVDEPIPASFAFSSAPIHFLDSPAFADNFGHFLIEHILSAYTAADSFGLDFTTVASSGQLVMYRKCMLHGHLDGKLRSDVCRWRYEETLKSFFDLPIIYLESLHHTETLCFRRLLAGHASAYSLKYQVRICTQSNLHRSKLLGPCEGWSASHEPRGCLLCVCRRTRIACKQV